MVSPEFPLLQKTPNYLLTISSGWRNPERNEAVGGARTSNHQYGKAVDLVVEVARTGLFKEQLYCILASAVEGVGKTPAPEIPGSTKPVDCNLMDVDHIHVSR